MGPMTAKQSACLQAMEMPVWRLRRPNNCHSSNQSENSDSSNSDRKTILLESAKTVANCRKCSLHRQRLNTVFGFGNIDADWLFVGEAPGAEEDRQGLPFVGRAGSLLNNMLIATGLTREGVYIANILKCRPPANRDPMGEEVNQCLPYLHHQIALIQPKIIIAMGRFAAQSLLQSNTPISQLRGELHYYGESRIPMVVSYHPAYLLRNPIDKRKAWQDLVLALETIRSL